MNNFCVHSYSGVSIVDTTGALRPCCKFSSRQSMPTIFDVDSLDNLHQLPAYKEIKQQLNAGKFPTGCRDCARAELAGLQSRRQFTNSMYSKHNMFVPDRVQDLEISLDYTCNMMCRMCNPGASSKWGSAHSVIKQFEQHSIALGQSNDYKTYQEQFRRVFENTDLSYARHVKLEGGEPFYAKHFEWFLDKLDREVIDKNKLFLNITTNGSVFPNSAIIEQLKSLNATISFSIDATGELAECLRWGVPWATVESNIKKFLAAGLECTTNITVSMLNINSLSTTIDFCNSVGIDARFSELTYPSYLSIYQLDQQTREKYTTGHSAVDDLIIAPIAIEPEFEKLEYSIHILDQYQGNDFFKINPEIKQLIMENKC